MTNLNFKQIRQIKKRDGTIVPFDLKRISSAIFKGMKAAEEGTEEAADKVAEAVFGELLGFKEKDKKYVPTVEEIQDIVEKVLILKKFPATAKAYILYRQRRAELRSSRRDVPENVRILATESKKYFKNALSEFVYYTTYSRWLDEENRRETWLETVDRYVSFMRDNLGEKLKEDEYAEIREYMLGMKVLGSMRLLQFSGRAAKKTNVAAYNCSFIAPKEWQDFGEIVYVLMCGTGVGFSVEEQTVGLLPVIKRQTRDKAERYVIEDSREGWADALVQGMKSWAAGKDVVFDYSGLRPRGARLKTMGGRSSGPEPLKSLLEFTRERMLARQGRRIKTIDAHDIICKIGEIVVAGGVRRSALISLSDLDDLEMREAKNGQFYLNHPERSMANNSVSYNEKPTMGQFLDEWINLAKAGSGERGIFNRGSLKHQLPTRRWKLFEPDMWTSGTNPCVTGDTLVYVADGRGHVPIRVLKEEGKDVPVFCFDKDGNVVVRYMRSPRLTGRQTAIFRVKLDDGSIIRATGNHKFMLRDGGYKEVGKFEKGESLRILTKFAASIKDIFPNANSNSQDYWWINNGKSRNQGEHRFIAEFYYQTKVPHGNVVHHRDRNAQNNNPSNLEILSKEDHDQLHGEMMKGDSNPMRRATQEWSLEKWEAYRQKHSINNSGKNNKNFSGIDDETLRIHALELTRLLERRFSHKDWILYAKERGLPQFFSKWRQDHLGGVLGIAKWAAVELGVDHFNEDPRVVQSYKTYTSLGYDCEIRDGYLVINKKCEVCGEQFSTDISKREYGVCSISCGLKRAWQDPDQKKQNIEALLRGHKIRKEKIKERQVDIYSELKFKLGRNPLKKEWMRECRDRGVSSEISRISSPLRVYSDLEYESQFYNHKVISVEFDGYEDVYNGTVDEFHNFFVGGFLSTTRNGKQKIVYLNNLQCGEIILKSKQFCNLSEVVARPEDTEDSLMDKVRVATILGTYQASLTNFAYLSSEWKKNCEEEALLGVSVTGQWDSPALRNPSTFRKLKEVAIETNRKYAERFGINRSTAITCVKPSGNGSQLFDSSSGMHPRHAKYYIRRVRIESHNPIFKMMRDMGVPHYPEVGQQEKTATTFVLEFPIKAPSARGTVFKDDLSAYEQLEYWKMVKENFTEHNPSTTISVGEDEWLKVGNWVYENWEMIGGLSFLPRSNHVYRLAPYEEITEERYKELSSNFPQIDFSKLVLYEYDDTTEVKKELACSAGVCEIDLPAIAPK